MCEKPFVLDGHCVCVHETCQLSGRRLSVLLSLILMEAQILQFHFQAGNLTLGQLVIWYFHKFGSLCVMTN